MTGRRWWRVVLAAGPATLLALLAATPSGAEPASADREEALRLFDGGDCAGAYERFRGLALHAAPAPAEAGEDLDHAVACLDRLGRGAEADELRERFAAAHADDWRALAALAESRAAADHRGILVSGRFVRGSDRGEDGRAVSSLERDRALAIGDMERALALAGADRLAPGDGGAASAADRARLRLRAADLLLLGRKGGRAWRLLERTTAEPLPGLEEGDASAGGDRGAPTGPDGEPVYHAVPERWDLAASDGERWRWLLAAARADDLQSADAVLGRLAAFARSQFGTQTLAGYPRLLDGNAGAGDAWALRTLDEDETIARLATGVRRFRLPRDYDFVAHFRELAGRGGDTGRAALRALAEIFETRRQYAKAADAWRRLIAGHGGGDGEPVRRLARIVEPRVAFEPAGSFVAGEPAVVALRFRNATGVRLEARPLDLPALLAEWRSRLETGPPVGGGELPDLDEVLGRVAAPGDDLHPGRTVAAWEEPLEPGAEHDDRTTTISTPLREAGAYLLTATAEGGATAGIVVRVTDTVIVHRRLAGGEWYFAADAATGAPLPGLRLDFLGYLPAATGEAGDDGRTAAGRTSAFSATTDATGQLVVDPERYLPGRRWLVTATEGGRLAFPGWETARGGPGEPQPPDAPRVYAVTDRPVYRPSQRVSWKIWAPEARRDDGDPSFAGHPLALRLLDARGRAVLEETVEADRFGGVAGSWELPADAPPGLWRLDLDGRGGGTFSVETARAPAFEVRVETHSGPVALGERFATTIRARQASGAPVAWARVLYRVRRTPDRTPRYPPGAWDWCYGPGYGWLAPESPWYPGWREWGGPPPAARAAPPAEPPELVAEQEVPIGPDGTARFVIDTALAAALHGDEDQRYAIEAEVTDRSHRTVSARGAVLVAQRPFRVLAWADRGHYRIGETVRAEVLAETPDHAPVAGAAVVTLYRVSYPGGEPSEKAVRNWAMRTDAEGRVRVRTTAAGEGQYRLAATVTDGEARSVEAGLLFTVAGPSFDGAALRFGDLELVPDRGEYAPGDAVRLQVNAARRGALVLLFERPEGGVYQPPRFLPLRGRSAVAEIGVGRDDVPGFSVEGLTVSDGRVHVAARAIVVPPAARALDVAVLPSASRYRPGEEATVRVRVTGAGGAPVAGTAALSVLDERAVQAAGGDAPDIRAFFWGVRRRLAPPTGVPGPAIGADSFATAFWAPTLALDAEGIAEVSFPAPGVSAGWRVRAWALGGDAAVGEGDARFETADDLSVTLGTPRFLVEGDEAVLSASVRSRLADTASLEAALELDGGCLEAVDDAPLRLEIPPDGEAQAHWRVRAAGAGEALVRVTVRTGSAAAGSAERRIPVRIRGEERTLGWSGSVQPGAAGATFTFTVPAAEAGEAPHLEARLSPTLAGVLADALPSLAANPHDSTEQTLNRFVPAVIVRRTLHERGLPVAPGAGAAVPGGSDLDAAVRAGLDRLAAMQLSDGGWGWFADPGERAGAHATAVVVHGLQAAAAAGVRLPPGILEGGIDWLERWQRGQLGQLRRAVARESPWKERADALDALVFATLAEAGREQQAMRGFLVRDRARLAPAGLAQLGLGLERLGKAELAGVVLRALEQLLVEDDGSGGARLLLPPGTGSRWWESETETLAAYLALLARTEPEGPRAAGVARHLVAIRRHGTSWDGTRDTALCVEALAAYLRARGAADPDLAVQVLLDGQVVREARFTAETVPADDGTVVLEEAGLEPGEHGLEFRCSGRGTLSAAATLGYLVRGERVAAAGGHLRIDRAAYRLGATPGGEGRDPAGTGEPARRPIAAGDELAPGELVEVELGVESDDRYGHVVVEDPRAAGLEPAAPPGGPSGDGVHLEVREDRVVFYLGELQRGRTTLRYRLRAGVPGRYTALPAQVAAMYAPWLRGRSGELPVVIAGGPQPPPLRGREGAAGVTPP